MHFGEKLRTWREQAGFVGIPVFVNAFNLWREARGLPAVGTATAYQWESYGAPDPKLARSAMEFLGIADPAEVLAALDSIQVSPRHRRALHEPEP